MEAALRLPKLLESADTEEQARLTTTAGPMSGYTRSDLTATQCQLLAAQNLETVPEDHESPLVRGQLFANATGWLCVPLPQAVHDIMLFRR